MTVRDGTYGPYHPGRKCFCRWCRGLYDPGTNKPNGTVFRSISPRDRAKGKLAIIQAANPK